jgi:hypothetical protein
MQKVAAYLLERRDALEPAARETEAERIRTVILAWLETKGAEPSSDQGQFVPVRGHGGGFLIEKANDSGRSWWMLTLNETSPEGVSFRTAVSVTTDDCVTVYLTLEAGLDHSRVGSLAVDPRCPRIVRDLLVVPGTWYHGRSRVFELQTVRGYHEGAALAEEIAFSERSIPVVVVSEDKAGSIAIPDLDRRIAYDLAGLANTCRIFMSARMRSSRISARCWIQACVSRTRVRLPSTGSADSRRSAVGRDSLSCRSLGRHAIEFWSWWIRMCPRSGERRLRARRKGSSE